MFGDCCDINRFLTSTFVDLLPKDQPVPQLNLANYKGSSVMKMQYLMHKKRICLRISYTALSGSPIGGMNHEFMVQIFIIHVFTNKFFEMHFHVNLICVQNSRMGEKVGKVPFLTVMWLNKVNLPTLSMLIQYLFSIYLCSKVVIMTQKSKSFHEFPCSNHRFMISRP